MQGYRCGGGRSVMSLPGSRRYRIDGSHPGIEVLRKALQDVEKISLAPLNGHTNDVTVSYGVVTASKITLSSTMADVLNIGKGEKGFMQQFAYEISRHKCFERELDGLNVQVAF